MVHRIEVLRYWRIHRHRLFLLRAWRKCSALLRYFGVPPLSLAGNRAKILQCCFNTLRRRRGDDPQTIGLDYSLGMKKPNKAQQIFRCPAVWLFILYRDLFSLETIMPKGDRFQRLPRHLL
jgi:hypothetical protein